jgi:ribonuclease Z
MLPHRQACRQPCHQLRPLRLFSAASSSGPSESEFARLVSGGKLTKAAVGKLSVAELRAECERLDLPSDGLKPALVARLLDWGQDHQKQQDEQPQQQVQQKQEIEQQQQQQQQPMLEQSAEAYSREMPAMAGQATSVAAASQAVPSATAPSSGVATSKRHSLGSRAPAEAAGEAGHVSVTWLGTSSGNPTPRRNVSAIAVRFSEDLYLVDCGEGTRNQVRHLMTGLLCLQVQTGGGDAARPLRQSSPAAGSRPAPSSA